ncbi:amastin-like protein [Leishmania braziliensis MHOM/BR/75/M2904]|uniref:Amastin-like protein n=2 Tax=Leishmania braziliensis TaxID=5660 RepID=A4H5H1_LEIBR|nr:amastin-like protein [Leishmania braziliensis MHOM/BR/75/M2904]CAJ2467143.1 unnamed protein product [Leishmania braziliensis]CAM37198.1 amastin-like protein [Leishmania braziliensis MHOM/BR/75/M2904]SYZ63163.1 amastin-like_protein [Leishmania braziliensis MHOM/BR/75/M2904]
MEFTLALLLYVIVQFIAFLCVLMGTPIDMFHLRIGGRFGNTPCITLWGLNEQCYTSRNDISLEQLWMDCPIRRDRFRRAQVFAIISICVYGLAALLGFIALCCCSCLRWVCLALNIAGIATLGIVWASMVVVYYYVDGRCIDEVLMSVFGSGFVLLVIAWCLDIINIAFLRLPWQARDPSKSLETSE